MKNPKSFLAIIFIGIVYAASMYFYKPYVAMYNQYEGDNFGYYVYLPAFFIHHDLPTLHTTATAKFSHCRPGAGADSSYRNKYFMGTAILQAPFFIAAHILAGPLHQPRDGFSLVYMYGVELSCLVYVLFGLFFIMAILRRYFSDSVTAVVIIIIALATNLYFSVVAQAPLSHPYLFFWYSVLLFATIRFYETYHRGYILLIGFVWGMIILTRLNEIYAILIPVLWGIRTRSDIVNRIALFRTFLLPIFGAFFLTALCILPQVMYWKVSTGHYLYYSYTGEKFDFLHPHIIKGLFDGSNGWLMYSPVMILSLLGIWPLVRSRHLAFVATLVFIPVHMYVIYSWWCWFYMGSYGSRPMIEAYPLLSIPLAYIVEWFAYTWIRRVILAIIAVFCIWLVMMQTYQTHLGFFNSELSNWRYNLVTLGKTKLTYEESIVLDTREFQPQDPLFVKMLGGNKFDSSNTNGHDIIESINGKNSICVHQGQKKEGFQIALSEAGAKPGQWIKASINCLAKEPTNHPWHLSSLVMAFTRKGKMTKWSTLSLQNKIDNPMHRIWSFPVNKWGRVYFYSQLPYDMTSSDTISVYVENIHDGPDIYINDLKVELYDKK